jgi:hypothetical protein
MTRSRKKTPITGYSTARSEKADKISAHRRERRIVHTRLKTDPDADRLPDRREVSNVLGYAKDGKIYAKSWLRPKDLRK